MFDFSHFLHPLLDHLLNIILDSFHLNLDIKTQINTSRQTFRKNRDVGSWTSPFSPDSLAPLGQYGDRGARSPCTAGTHTFGRSCRTAPGAVGAVYTFASPASLQVWSACGSSRLQLAGVAPGDFRNMRPGTRGRISQPLIASLCTRHNVRSFSPGTRTHSASSGGSSPTFP